MTSKKKSYPQGYWLGIGIAIGGAISFIFSVAMFKIANTPGLLPISIAVGIGAGIAVGIGLEAKYNTKPQPIKSLAQRLMLIITLFGGILIFASLLALSIIKDRI